MKSKKKTVSAKPKKMAVASKCSNESALVYENDFFKWTQMQSSLLKKGLLQELDIANLIEEIESLGRSDKRALKSFLVVLLMHLLKMKYQSEKQKNSNSWRTSIVNATRDIKYLIEDSPSLQNELIKNFSNAYQDARVSAAQETEMPLKTFPKESPWEIDEVLPFLKKKKTKNS